MLCNIIFNDDNTNTNTDTTITYNTGDDNIDSPTTATTPGGYGNGKKKLPTMFRRHEQTHDFLREKMYVFNTRGKK